MKTKSSLLDSLNQIFGKEKPLVKLLSTSSGFYLYDTGTNKMLGCEKDIHDLLNELLKNSVKRAAARFIGEYGESRFVRAAAEIIDAVEEEKILKVKKACRFGQSDHFSDLKDVLSDSVQGVNLEVTQDCNLRCIYCIYQDHVKEKRQYSHKEMSIEIAAKAIDLLKKHSSSVDDVSIGFFGGEPLKSFSLIKQSVEFAKKVFTQQKVNFNITTNGTLISREIAEFLITEGFFVMVSLDGPKEYHDKFRKDAKGNGSFERTLNGLRLLSNAYSKQKNGTIAINLVNTPPFNQDKLDAIDQFFKELEWLPDVHILSRNPNNNSIPIEYVRESGQGNDKGLFGWAIDQYRIDFDQSNAIIKGQVEERFAKFLQRPVLTEPASSYPLNGCCVPGQRKNYITADGFIQVCEKMPDNSPYLGHVNTGFDFERIKKVYVDEYARKSLDECSRCWALRLCDVCYIYAFNDDGELDMNKKRRHCKSILDSVETSMCYFLTLMDEHPGKLDYLYHFEIK